MKYIIELDENIVCDKLESFLKKENIKYQVIGYKKESENEILDWEYQTDFYNEGPEKILTLEEMQEESSADREVEARLASKETDDMDPELAMTLKNVKNIRVESENGGTIKEIAVRLNLSEDYVNLVLMTMEGYSEDSDFAVAHLVMLG